MSSIPPIITVPPPPLKRVSTWMGAATAAVGLAALESPEVTASIIATATKYAGDNAVGVALVSFGVNQAFWASRRWLQARAARSRSA